MWDLTVTYASGTRRHYKLSTRERQRSLKRALQGNATAAGIGVVFDAARS